MVETRIAAFAPDNRWKVRFLVEEWQNVRPGQVELSFVGETTTVFRACPYPDDDNHLMVSKASGTSLGKVLCQRFGGKALSEGNHVRISLNGMTQDDLKAFLDLLY